MTDEKALITTNQPSALDVYGSGDDIKLLAKRIKVCLPGGDKLQEHDALALAQLSVAYGLNPFNGEVWIIVDKQGTSRGTMVGIKGLRKAARRQGNYWPVFGVLGKEEKKEIGIPDNAIAYRCLIYRTDLLRQSAEAIDLMRKAGMENAHEVYAYKPAEGIGYATPGEMSKMKDDQRARKRAEAEALKVAFDLPFASEVGTNGDQVGYVDTEWSEVQDTTPKLTGEALQAKMATNIQAMRGDVDDDDPLGIETHGGPDWDDDIVQAGEEPPPIVAPSSVQPEHDKKARPWSAEIVRGAMRKKSGVWAKGMAGDWSDAEPVGHDGRRKPASESQVKGVVSVMAAAITRDGMMQAAIDADRHAILSYIFDVASTNDLCAQECSAILDLWKAAESWEPNEYAAAEAAAIITAWQKMQGQAELL